MPTVKLKHWRMEAKAAYWQGWCLTALQCLAASFSTSKLTLIYMKTTDLRADVAPRRQAAVTFLEALPILQSLLVPSSTGFGVASPCRLLRLSR